MHGRGSMIPRSNANAPLQQPRGLTVSAQNSHSKVLGATRENNMSQLKAPKYRCKDDLDMLGGSVDGCTSVRPMTNFFVGVLNSPQAQKVPQNRIQLQFKPQASTQGTAAKKSPNNVLSHSFQISRQQQLQSNANRVAENARYTGKRSDVTANHQSQIKSIEKLASTEIAERIGRIRQSGQDGKEGLSHSRSDNQRQARTAMGQFQMLGGFDPSMQNTQTLPWPHHQHSVITQVQQRRTQVASGIVQYPKIHDSNPQSKKDTLLGPDDLVQFSCSQTSSKQEPTQSYYVQMLKTSQGNKLMNRQSTDRQSEEGVQNQTAPMPDHLSDKMLQRNHIGQNKHSTSDYNFKGVKDLAVRGTPTTSGSQIILNHPRFNNMTHFQKYKQQNRHHREGSISGPRKHFGDHRAQPRTSERSTQKLAEVLPRHNSQALNIQQAINSKQTVSQQFSMAENLKQIQQQQSQSAMSQHQKGTPERKEDAPPDRVEQDEESAEGNYGQAAGNAKDNQAAKHFNTQQQEGSQASTGQTIDSTVNAAQGAAGGPQCQWWQNNYLSFRCRMKQELEQQPAVAERVRPAVVVNNLLKIKSNERREAATTKFAPGAITRYPNTHAETDGSRATMSLLSNKPLRVGNHCAQNLMVDQLIVPSDQRMIKNKKVATVSSAIGYYGLNMNYNPYVKPMDKPEAGLTELETKQGREKNHTDLEDKAVQSVKTEGLKINLGQSSYQDEGNESQTAARRLKLASARHARPPKGMSNLCSASNKVLENTCKHQPHELLQRPSAAADSTHKESATRLISAKRHQGSQQRARENDEHRQRSAQRRRLKSTQLSVDMNKVRHQQEFLEHRTRLVAQKQQKQQQQPPVADEYSSKTTFASVKKRRQGTRPQSSKPSAQMSRRKNRGERNGKRSTLLSSNQKKFSSRKCNEVLSDLEQVAKETESIVATTDRKSKDLDGNNSANVEKKCNSVLKVVRTHKLNDDKQDQDAESKILPLLPLPPRIDSSRRTKPQKPESSRQISTSSFGQQIRKQSAKVDSQKQLSMICTNNKQSNNTSGMHSPDLRRKSSSSITPSQGQTTVKLRPQPSNESLNVTNDKQQTKQLYESADIVKQSQLEIDNHQEHESRSSYSAENKARITIEPSKSSPALVKAQQPKEEDVAGATGQVNQSDVSLPQISAQAFLIYDCNTCQVLLSRKGTQKREVASITKMMTFYTVLKLIERYHSCLQSYGYNIANESCEVVEIQKKSSSQALESNVTTAATNANGTEAQNANSSTSSTSNSNNLRARQSSNSNGNLLRLSVVSGQGTPAANNNRNLDQCLRLQARISRKASKVPGTTANLREGDILTIDQLLYGMMLPSGNDAAYALAEFFGRVVKERKYSQGAEDEQRASGSFVKTSTSHSPYIKYFLLEMNFYAQKLGLINTVYDSPHGLINKHNVSCASDIAKLVRECMIGGPRPKGRKMDDFMAFQKLLADQEPKEGAQGRGWVQQVYRRVVGTKRHETTAIVPVEMTAKEVKKQKMKAKKKNSATDLCSEEDEDQQVEQKEDEEKDKVPKIKLKTRRYRWENTNKLLNVEIDQNKQEQTAQDSAQKSSIGQEGQPLLLPRTLGAIKNYSPDRKPAYTGGYIVGCKTGITQSAGPCFAGFYENEELGVQLALIVLHSQTSDLRWHEIRQMVRWAHLCDRSKVWRKKQRRKVNVQSQEAQREKEAKHAQYVKQCKEMQKNIFGI